MGQEELSDVPLSAESDPMADNLHNSNEIAAGAKALPGKNDPCVKAVAGVDEEDSAEDLDEAIRAYQGGDLGGKGVRTKEEILRPLPHLPQPEAPPGLTKSLSTGGEDFHRFDRSMSLSSSSAMDMASIGKFIRDTRNSFSAAIVKRISSLREGDDLAESVTEFHLSGLKVVVRRKDDDNPAGDGDYLNIKGRISFFSRSGCRDCGAVRSFFRSKGLPFVEINIDVFPEREKELVERMESASVPAIFFNERFVGGLVVLNSLRNSGEFERRLKELAGRRCSDSAPRVPVYGFDDEEEGKKRREDPMVGVIRILRQRLPIQDRITKMKLVKNCFAGSDMVEALIRHLDYGRQKAIEIGKDLARRHFIHHVFRENEFEDSNNEFYRFLEHDPAVSKCFNIRGGTNDDEPQPALAVGHRLTKLMSAILESYASDDRRHLDYARIGASEEFRRFTNVVQDLQRVDLFQLSTDERLAFFLNLYNAMVIHANIRPIGRPGIVDRRSFFNDFQYIIGGYPYSLSTIKDGILRSNRRPPYSFVRPLSSSDRRLDLGLPKLNNLIHFGLCNGTRSSPTVRFFSAQGVDVDLRHAAREFFSNGGLEVDLEKRTVHLTRIVKWYSADFGQERDFLQWVVGYLEATKAGLLMHLLNDGGPVNIVYQSFDWSLNSFS
ncbi:hypothetical protein AXF42_Ash020637 [Apostasia shenzhenica]|uniref:DEP domain-containing protein n=1 Tax=Apostasia shenzhenica TaxID=1088818 RepID=A0A2H9ZY64_9ASPA|nr:hypothetical protein AXF42_Ash020637 [Apostasia shenzhenica]